MPRYARVLTTFILVLGCAACGAALDPQPRPASVGHMDMPQKEEYILRTKATLKTFHATAIDLRSRATASPLQELGENFDRYVALQVVPIIEDGEARNNLATRMETVKLTLLCGLIYVELDDQPKIADVLVRLKEHGSDPGIFDTPLDRGDLGVATIDEGIKKLEESMAATLSRRSASLFQPTSDSRKDPLWKRIFSIPSPKESSAP